LRQDVQRMRRSYHRRDFPAPMVLAAKRARRVSVCLPARNEEATVAHAVVRIREELMERWPIVDELVVVDDGSTDATAEVAAAAGAFVVAASQVLPDYGQGPGKGQAMWKGVHVTSGEVVVFCDADIADFDPSFILGLAGPLLARDDISFVKGFYERPLDGRPGEGGRVTELMARPLISTFFPHLSDLAQPLSGECAAPREVLESVPFVGGYGVDLGLLIDVTAKFGNASLVQSDLGVRVHRNRSLADLGPQALAIMQVGLYRAGMSGSEWGTSLVRPDREPVVVAFSEQPPLCDVPAHRMTA
jgi:glucosyl-3-phosphoglycerate synthase